MKPPRHPRKRILAAAWLSNATAFSRGGPVGAFSVSESNVEAVRAYIREQAEHHRQRTFQEEFRLLLEKLLLEKHKIEWDERYVWD
jgi:putative transposase